MKVKLTGIIELQTEVEVEVEDEHFQEWRKMYPAYYLDDKLIPNYFRDFPDDRDDAWRHAPQDLNDPGYEVIASDFFEAEVLDG